MKLRYVAPALLLVVTGVLLYEFQLSRGSTPPIRGPDGEMIPGSIATLDTMELGGVEQWILIRGQDRTAPVVLFLHGGPGNPAMYLAHAFQRPLEGDFVMVHWDRRGAGKSYEALESTGDLTVRQMLDDTHQLARRLAARFGKEGVYLLGHSWGSYLGVLAVREEPGLYRGYIGTGQVAASPDSVGSIRRRRLAELALAAGDTTAARAFRDGSRSAGEEALFEYGAELRGVTSFWPILWTGLEAPEYTILDALAVRKGIQRSGAEMRRDVIDGPLMEEVRALSVPVAMLLGRYDLNTPSELAVDYLEELDAPLKWLVCFDDAAHFPFLSRSERFGDALRQFHRGVTTFRERGSAGNDAPASSMDSVPPGRCHP